MPGTRWPQFERIGAFWSSRDPPESGLSKGVRSTNVDPSRQETPSPRSTRRGLILTWNESRLSASRTKFFVPEFTDDLVATTRRGFRVEANSSCIGDPIDGVEARDDRSGLNRGIDPKRGDAFAAHVFECFIGLLSRFTCEDRLGEATKQPAVGDAAVHAIGFSSGHAYIAISVWFSLPLARSRPAWIASSYQRWLRRPGSVVMRWITSTIASGRSVARSWS